MKIVSDLHIAVAPLEQQDEDGATGHAIADLSPQLEMKSEKTKRWTRLHAIEIENFKAIKKTTIPLGDVTILVGPNGSGKSSVLQAVHWAARAASYIEPKNTKEVVSFERLDYLPSSEPLRTAYRSTLSTTRTSPPTRISFIHVGSVPDAVVATTTDPIADSEENLTEAGTIAAAADRTNSSLTTHAASRDVVDDEAAVATSAAIITGPAATVKIWAARNQGGISVHIDGAAAVTPFKQRAEPLTAYIPGLAGLSEKEAILAQPLLRRQAASGDAGGVLRNVLFNLASRLAGELDDSAANQRINRLNELIQSVHPLVSVRVSYDDREDIHIKASFSDSGLSGDSRPLESAATGVLQVVQIFAYIVFFQPKVLLIDEPDAHLHPDKQERLIEALEAAAAEFQAQIILTTHSQHIVRAASSSTQLVWMNGGGVVSDDHGPIRRNMGWGSMDKKLLMFVEDEEDQPIRAVLRQWPELYRQLAVCRCFGVENLPKNKLLDGLMEVGNLDVKAVLHRDRDFMTVEECAKWVASYTAPNVYPWHTQQVDVEAYFCEAGYLQALYGVDEATANEWRRLAAERVKGSKDKFISKRGEINRLLYSMNEGGQPSSEDLWKLAGEKCPGTTVGKALLGQLKTVITEAKFPQYLLNNYSIPSGYVVAPELKTVIETALAQASRLPS